MDLDNRRELQSPVSEQMRHGSPSVPSSLPEDDGMHLLRQKMREIHNLAVSTEEKAKQMHYLMTQDYLALNTTSSVLWKPATQADQETVVAASDPYNVTLADVEPTYCPGAAPSDGMDDSFGNEEQALAILGCAHYSRNVKIQCFDCRRWFPCRHCHDTSPILPFPHFLNRSKTENMLCMLCHTPQPAGESCTNCGVETAYYYCPKCKLWDNDSTKRIYHCDDCGICRRGEGLGRDYVHCKRCNVCISISTSFSHPCIERATDCNCPLCLDHLFSSSTAVVSLLCGHYMHAACYRDLMTVTYRCPVCNKSAVNMELQWRKLDDEIKMQPMPDDDNVPPSVSHLHLAEDSSSQLAVPAQNPARRIVPKIVWIGCNDCGGRGWTPFHWLGLKCPVCDGYNTTQMTPVGSESVSRSIPAIARQRQHDFTGLDAMRSLGPGNGEISLFRNDEEASQLEQQEGDRVDSAYGCQLPASEIPIPLLPPTQSVPQLAHSPSGRSYFLRAEQEAEEAAVAAAAASAAGAGVGRRDYRMGMGMGMNMSMGSMGMGSMGMGSMGEGIRSSLPLPYDIIRRVSRSLSPMRYYLEGFDIGQNQSEGGGGAAAGAAGEAVMDGLVAARGREVEVGEGVEANIVDVNMSGEADPGKGFWGADGSRILDPTGNEADAERDEDGGSSSGSDDDDDDESVASDLERLDGPDDDDMALFGHL